MDRKIPTLLQYRILCALRGAGRSLTLEEIFQSLERDDDPAGKVSWGSLHPTLVLMERMAMVQSALDGDPPARGGRPGRLYWISEQGREDVFRGSQFFLRMANLAHAS